MGTKMFNWLILGDKKNVVWPVLHKKQQKMQKNREELFNNFM